MKTKSNILHGLIINSVIVCLLVSVFCVGFAFNKSGSVFDKTGRGAIYSGDKNKAEVCIMFNVYGGTEYIPDILATLKKHDVKVTFFVGGCWVAKNEDVFLKIIADGHEIGSHGYFHKDHAKLDYEGNYNEIFVTHKLVKELAGIEMNLFAPPSGSFDSLTLKVADKLNYTTIMWSKDTIDWRDHDVNKIYSRATKNVKNGDFVLMHPTKHTAAALDKIISFYRVNGFSVGMVGNNIKGIT